MLKSVFFSLAILTVLINRSYQTSGQLSEYTKCPDNQMQCKKTQSCCLLEDNSYGCCPFVNSSCCDDKIHCCPQNYRCNTDKGKCDFVSSTGKVFSVNWAEKVVKKAKDAACPDGKSECPSDTTCCALASGEYGCCPLPSAVCCTDHEHCCPSGYTCDVKDGRCNKGDVSLPFYRKIAASKRADPVKDVVCPGGQSECPSGTTCCALADGEYGCCPYASAVCCNDQEHCCPSGYTCDVKDGRCNKAGESSLPFVKKIASNKKVQPVKDVVCPGGKSDCPADTTCCALADGEYGCCPYPSAVCCSDQEHCCPSGYTCDVKDGRCNKAGELSLPFVKKIASNKKPQPVKDVVCPGGKSDCPADTTCCALADGEYGCCPYPSAVCCSDQEHCCPSGYTCDVKDGRCNKAGVSFPFQKKIASTKKVQPVKDVVCPGGKSDCPADTTCCALADGEYGCCLYPSAVCCTDQEHCCPSGYTCDVKDGRCNKAGVSFPFQKKIASTKKVQPVKDVVCPGGKSDCPADTTCCALADGEYGCCPYPSAVCCSDQEHCCPSGYTCDVKDGRCNKAGVSFPFVKKIASNKKVQPVKDVVCPGGKSDCPADTTCCALADGEYGCCPYPSAVCCSDQEHCCPSGYTCDVKDGRCNKAGVSFPFQKKIASTKRVQPVKDVVCPGGKSDCPADTTCCALADGEYGCCPYPSAVCCSDQEHCCPSGYTCDVKDGRCNKAGANSIEFITKFAARKVAKILQDVVCPGGKSVCPSGTTCCTLDDGSFGCCPLENAICCSDNEHCCPQGYTCDLKDGRCNNGRLSVPFFKKTAATKKAQDVACPGGQSECPDGATCCALADGDYGCCPLPSAACCDDHIHCCPQGYTCDVNDGRCNKGADSMPFFTKFAAKKTQKEAQKQLVKVGDFELKANSVVCPDGSSFCPNSYTCCQMSDQSYGCCPLKNGVCCEDHLHCCPSNTKCDLNRQTCVSSDALGLTSLLEKLPAKMLFKKGENKVMDPVLCADKVTTCDPLKTCCKMSGSDKFGCCPHTDGVCCDWGCCPSSTKCGESVGQCLPVEDSKTSEWSSVEFKAKSMPKTVEKLKLDCELSCSNKSTCCPTATGDHACCPYSNGICCGPEGYCCPKGYTCDATKETCELNDQSGVKHIEPLKVTKFKETHRKFKLLAERKLDDLLDDEACPDMVHFCKAGHTCCQSNPVDGGTVTGCCASVNAECCMDGVNCCPSDYKCSVVNSKVTCAKKNRYD